MNLDRGDVCVDRTIQKIIRVAVGLGVDRIVIYGKLHLGAALEDICSDIAYGIGEGDRR